MVSRWETPIEVTSPGEGLHVGLIVSAGAAPRSGTRVLRCALLRSGPWPGSAGAASPILGEGLKASAKGIDARLRLRLHADLVESCLGALGQAAGANDGSASDVGARGALSVSAAPRVSAEAFRLRAPMNWGPRGALARSLHTTASSRGWDRAQRRAPRRIPTVQAGGDDQRHLSPFIERSATNTFTPGRSAGQTSLRSAHAPGRRLPSHPASLPGRGPRRAGDHRSSGGRATVRV